MFRHVDAAAARTERQLTGTSQRSRHAIRTFSVGAGAALAAGVTVELDKAAHAAVNAESTQAKLAVAFKNAHVVYKDHGAAIETVLEHQAALTGFTKEDLSDALANMVRTTHNANEALKLNATAMDIARTKGTGLQQAQSILARVYNGSFIGLKRLGVAVQPVTAAQDKLRESTTHASVEQVRHAKALDATATRQQALGKVMNAFKGQAVEFGKTTAGQWQRSRAELEILNERLGVAFLPILAKVSTALLNMADAIRTNHLERIGKILDPLLRNLEQTFDKIAPQIANAAARAAPSIAGAFVNAFLKADVWGKLLVTGWLLKKLGGLGLVAGIGKKVAGSFAEGFAASAAGAAAGGAVTRGAGEAAAGTARRGLLDRFGGTVGGFAGGLALGAARNISTLARNGLGSLGAEAGGAGAAAGLGALGLLASGEYKLNAQAGARTSPAGLDLLHGLHGDVAGTFKSIATAASGIATAAKGAAGGVASLWRGLTKAPDVFKQSNAFAKAMNAIEAAASRAAKFVGTQLSKLWHGVAGAVAPTATAAAAVGASLWGGIQSGATGAVRAVRGAISAAVGGGRRRRTTCASRRPKCRQGDPARNYPRGYGAARQARRRRQGRGEGSRRRRQKRLQLTEPVR
jgi:hypothetical protein